MRRDVPQFQHGRYSDSHAYAQSKLMDIMFNVELAKRAPAGVTCASLHPGVIDTKLLREGVGMFGGTPLTRCVLVMFGHPLLCCTSCLNIVGHKLLTAVDMEVFKLSMARFARPDNILPQDEQRFRRWG